MALVAVTAWLGLVTPAAAEGPPIHSIGIISTCGRTFTLVESATFGSGSDPQQSSVPDWHIDDLIEAQAEAALAGRYAVKILPHDQPPGDPSGAELVQAATRAMPGQSFDAYLLIMPEARDDTIFGGPGRQGVLDTHTHLKGIGLYLHHDVVTPAPRIFSACRMVLAVAPALKILSEVWLEMPRKHNAFVNLVLTMNTTDAGIFAVGITPKAWAPTVAELSPDQRQLIRDGLKNLIVQEVPWTLQRMELLP